jgi:hypothetical protein
VPESASAACFLHQDAPHRLGGRPEEVTAPAPRCAAVLPHQAQVRFMHQAGGVERLAGSFPRQLLCRQAAQFFIDERQKPAGCFRLALPSSGRNAPGLRHEIVAFCVRNAPCSGTNEVRQIQHQDLANFKKYYNQPVGAIQCGVAIFGCCTTLLRLRFNLTVTLEIHRCFMLPCCV